jgi:tRNA pseudouridine13 synthase
MIPEWPRAAGPPCASAVLRSRPEDFRVSEELGFEPAGEGEHLFLYLQKRGLNTLDLVQRLAQLSGVPRRDIGYSGLKDRNAVTRQWFSVRMAGRQAPDWAALASAGDVQVLAAIRHQRKLRRGVHRRNRFTLVLREVAGDHRGLEERLQRVRARGVPNYFGEQRFGREGATLQQARAWMASRGRRISRERRGLYLSALRAQLFNMLLAARVASGDWDRLLPGDVCMLQGTRSLFSCDEVDETLQARARCGDVHPALPLAGRGSSPAGAQRLAWQAAVLAGEETTCEFLQEAGLELAWRPARMLVDDFSWRFCDDRSLQLAFALPAGGYATALLAELVHYGEGQPGAGRTTGRDSAATWQATGEA